MNARGVVAVTIAVIGGLGLAACGDSASDDDVGVSLTDFEVTADSVTAKAGETTFEIDNDAEQVHEFVVVKTDLAAADLPLDEDGLIDERGEGLEFIDEVENVQGGESGKLTVDLTPGTYILLCNLPDHFAEGMHTGFTVT